MLKWSNKKGWYLKIRYWGISFCTPRKMYFFGWWNPFTKRILIYTSSYYDEKKISRVIYFYPLSYNL